MKLHKSFYPLLAITASLFVGSLSLFAAEDSQGTSFESAKGKAAQKKYEAAVKKADEERRKKIKAAQKVYARELGTALKDAMKKGDLGEANKISAIKKEIGGSKGETGISGARKLILWNTLDGNANNRGTLEVNVSLFHGQKQVWRKDNITVKWKVAPECSTTVRLPKNIRFDRVRVDITKWVKDGGGLAEIEVIAGKKNIAQGCQVKASATYDRRYHPSAITDGRKTTRNSKGKAPNWILPSRSSGWVELYLGKKR